MNVNLNCNYSSNPAFGKFVISDDLMKDISRGHYFKQECSNFSERIYEDKMNTLMNVIKADESNPVINSISYIFNNLIKADCRFPQSSGIYSKSFYFNKSDDICDFFKLVSAESGYALKNADKIKRGKVCQEKLQFDYLQKLKNLLKIGNEE